MAVTGPWWRNAFVINKSQIRRECRVNRLLHGNFDQPALTGECPLEERCHNSCIEVDPAQKIDDSGATFNRWPIREPGNAHHPRCCLNGNIHSEVVAIGP